MGATEVPARIYGESEGESRKYTFLVDTGATYLALPLEEVEALGLQRRRGKIRVETVTGVVDTDVYVADGELMGQEFTALMIPGYSPLLGYELLQNLRFKVNPVTHEIERVPNGQRHPPYL